MALQLVRIEGPTRERMLALEGYDLDLKHRAGRQLAPDRFEVPALADDRVVAQLRHDGWQVEQLGDAQQVAAARLAEVSRVNRFADARALDEYAERSVLGYMSNEEIDAAMAGLAAAYPALVTEIVLPHATVQGRTSRALRLRAGTSGTRPGVLFTGAMHAREWGGSDLLIHLAIKLLQAHAAGTGTHFGAKAFTADQVRHVLERLDLFVFPNVNPDGKAFSQGSDPTSLPAQQNLWWRKNRNPNGGAAVGVDINRNFDFLWTSGIGSSASPSSNLYRGTGAFSEPEARNVRHLFDSFPHIRYYVDVHSHGQLLLYSWGDDENQSHAIDQRFTNPAYSGVRGTVGDSAYREFIAPLDEHTVRGLALRMHDAIHAVRGKSYTVEQAVGLYPTSGTADDYAFSRHVATPSRAKVYGFTVEFGTEFVPPHAEMLRVMDDVAAGLTEFCWATLSDVHLRDNATDSGDIPSAGAFWNSPDIWVRQADDGDPTHQDTLRGRDNFVHVRVHNRGAAEARGLRVRVSLSSFAGTEFVYPQDWLPRNPSGGGSIGAPGTYWIGDAPIALLAPASETIVSVRWPAALIPPDAGWHPCLLVEVSPNDGLAAGGHEVRDHNNLGQKNVTIVNARAGQSLSLPFRLGSPFAAKAAGSLWLRARGVTAPLAAELETRPAAPQPERPAMGASEDTQPPLAMKLLAPALVAVGHDRPVHLRIPAGTLMQAAGAVLAGPRKRPQTLWLRPEDQGTRLPLTLLPKGAADALVRLRVPSEALAGSVFELEVVQLRDDGSAAGGVVLQVHVR